MTSERWREVEAIYQSVMDREPASRGAYLAEVCKDDSGLRREVESLLRLNSSPVLVDQPAWQAAAELLDNDSTVAAGTQLGPYRIEGVLGAGGMGQVYSARDTRLDRLVAIKVSKEEFNERFEREARAVAALNHPNICTLHDVGPNYLVMELVEGPTLAERIKQGPIPLEEALAIARQIADALEAAHERGIIHRDLKPANIKIKPDGTLKVLDFGLAKRGPPGGTPPSNPEDSPTISAATSAGVILGTAGYMSPEQARGHPVDKRADIWAFGVVLYEMLTGEKLFEGESVSDTLAAVLTKGPEWSRVHPKAQRLLQRCLEKDPKRRLRDIGDAWELLERVPPAIPVSKWSRLPWLAAAAATIFGVAVGLVHFLGSKPEARVVKLSLLPPEGVRLLATSPPTVSPDGRRVAFAGELKGRNSLWVQDLDGLAAVSVPGTERGRYPFWSPDSRSLGFFDDRTLKKTDLATGVTVSLSDANGHGASWGPDGTVVFSPKLLLSGIARVPAGGGKPSTLTRFDPTEHSHRFPSVLPDGRSFLYLARSLDPKASRIYAADIGGEDRSRQRQEILQAASNVAYAPEGYLLYVRERTLMAQRFDTSKLKLTSEPVPVAERVGYNDISNWGQFSVSQNGVLVYTSGDPRTVQLIWFDRSGNKLGTVSAEADIQWPALSPDGSSVLLDRRDPRTGMPDIWRYDLTRGVESRLTSSGWNRFVVWSPDGANIAHANGLVPFISSVSAPAGRQGEAIAKAAPPGWPTDWSRDGRYIVMQAFDNEGGFDIWVLPLFGDRRPFPYLKSEFSEKNAKISPSGEWVAYVSNETGDYETYVQSFPVPGSKVRVSAQGGRWPIWSRDGKELFFIALDRQMMNVQVNSAGKFQAGVPMRLFPVRLMRGEPWFDVSKDGRFLIPTEVERTGVQSITVVLNWTSLLKK